MSLLWFCCLVLHTVGLTLAQSPDVFITYSIDSEDDGRQAACPGEEVTFECTVVNARSLRWIVEPFISDDQIVFQLSNNTGDEIVVMPFKAVLTGVEMMENFSDYGQLNSELLVTASESLRGTVVKCLATGNITMNKTLTLAAPPSPPQQLSYSVTEYHLNDFTVAVQWERPASDGGADIKLHTVTTAVSQFTFDQITLMATLTLSYNEMHIVSITASNCAGKSTASVVTIHEVGCGPPTPPLHGSLGDLNSSQAGTVVNFQCNPGLVSSQQMMSVCATNRSWTPDPAEIVCRADCGDPSLPVNGFVMAFDSTLEGSQIVFQCSPGFVPSQQMMSVCAANGSWTPDTTGLVCRADCGIPTIVNGSVNYTTTVEESTATYQCDAGLIPVGVMTAMCMKNGDWAPDPAGVGCRLPGQANCGIPVIVNGSVNYTTTVEGSTATYQCDTGLVPEGVITAMCMENGEWAPDPGCRLLGQVTDGAPPSPMDASLSTADTTASTDTSLGLSTAEVVGVTFVLSSVVSFTAGLLVALVISYCYIRQQKSQSSPGDLQQPVPTYENISTTINKKIEMKENAAYGLINH